MNDDEKLSSETEPVYEDKDFQKVTKESKTGVAAFGSIARFGFVLIAFAVLAFPISYFVYRNFQNPFLTFGMLMGVLGFVFVFADADGKGKRSRK